MCLESAQGDDIRRNNCKTSFLDCAQSDPEGKEKESKTSFLDSAQSDPEGKEKERCKLTVPPYIISVLDHKQELWTPERDKQENWQGPVLTSPFSEETREQDDRCNIVGSDKPHTVCEWEEQEIGKPAPPDIRRKGCGWSTIQPSSLQPLPRKQGSSLEISQNFNP